MFKQLAELQFLQLAQQHRYITVYQEIPGDMITPISAYHALESEMAGATLLESSPKERAAGRHSFLGFHPFAEFRAKGDSIAITEHGKSKVAGGDVLAELEAMRQRLSAPMLHPLAGFAGGMAGYVAYDAVRLFEKIPDSHTDEDHIPDIKFNFYRDHINFDHISGCVVLATVVEVGEAPAENYAAACRHLEQLHHSLLNSSNTATNPFAKREKARTEATPDLSDEAYAEVVVKAKQHIRDGDVFQVVPSRRFQRSCAAQPFNLYRALRITSPSPYMFFLDEGAYQIIGASPERLISVQNGIVESCPLAGTRPRSEDEAADAALAQELLDDEKETAEHMMLVDLARNDVGAVAEAGAVTVTELKQVHKYSHVMHLSSTVQGHLAKDKTALDALRYGFPAGTLSGAPKIRAMQLIDELENSRRGMYGGGICTFDYKGNLDSCIAIRMAVLKDGQATVRTGAGIVFDSDPQLEAQETRHKARSVLEAIALAEGEE